jgi:hypothetical protein
VYFIICYKKTTSFYRGGINLSQNHLASSIANITAMLTAGETSMTRVNNHAIKLALFMLKNKRGRDSTTQSKATTM